MWVRPPLGAPSVRKLSHLGVRNSSTWINNAYTNAYTLPEDFKAMSYRSVPSQTTHLHSSRARAPTASAIVRSDQRGPPIVKFSRLVLCTRHEIRVMLTPDNLEETTSLHKLQAICLGMIAYLWVQAYGSNVFNNGLTVLTSQSVD